MPFSPSTRKAARHKMTLIATLLAFLVFFSGLAVAQISAPNCNSTWAWVCILSFPQCVFWPSPDLMVFSSSRSILSAKMRVMSQRSCWGHAIMAVSYLLVCLPCIGESCRLVFFAVFTIGPLQGSGYAYRGPQDAEQDANLCRCNTVVYSLISACGACQEGRYVTYDSCCYYLPNSRGLFICI